MTIRIDVRNFEIHRKNYTKTSELLTKELRMRKNKGSDPNKYSRRKGNGHVATAEGYEYKSAKMTGIIRLLLA